MVHDVCLVENVPNMTKPKQYHSYKTYSNIYMLCSCELSENARSSSWRSGHHHTTFAVCTVAQLTQLCHIQSLSFEIASNKGRQNKNMECTTYKTIIVPHERKLRAQLHLLSMYRSMIVRVLTSPESPDIEHLL